jgi:hypothetical protein
MDDENIILLLFRTKSDNIYYEKTLQITLDQNYFSPLPFVK